ncbi:hypothetical protein [Nonomuraea basaltis]|uniref:hypothetical protein n=1 Tax=Nonomuraea basaltis TaxID=2495887 RepID=UPI00110C41E2|nr:hypothetical protein [Nonomuraea basaltis]TMR87955.1 hypothetical protein EJK15_68905 [Nonomuraea basaltis]
MTTSRTDETVERACYLPVWDEATEEFHNAWMNYRTADPYFVHLEIEDWPAPVVAPRAVVLDGQNGRAECLSKPDRTALRVEPTSDGRHVRLGVTQGDLLLAVFRTPADVFAKQVTGLYELVPDGEEMARIEWDAVIANILGT